jgi:ubiquinone/menaquinone biosynthesis C-methylase UbiE
MDFEEEYYNLQKSKGVDYNFYGDWQKSYAKMVVNITQIVKHTNKGKPTLLDVGCACGINTRAFKELNVFGWVKGIDISNHMIKLGQETHNLHRELLAGPIDNMPIRKGTVDLIHCSQVLEHCYEEDMPKIVAEFNRVLTPQGLVFITLPTIHPNQSEEEIKAGDPTHITVKPASWWAKAFSKLFTPLEEIDTRWKEDMHSPDNTEKTFYDYYKDHWTLFLFTRR